MHPLFNPAEVPLGGISLFKADWMHTKSLGTDAYLLGSCLTFLVSHVLPGTADQNIGLIWDAVQGFYQANRTPCRLSRLTMGMVSGQPFPKLSAKAMETRHLLPAVEHFFKGVGGNPLVAWFHRLVSLAWKLDEIVFANKTMLLSVRERQALKQGLFRYNQVLTRLARTSTNWECRSVTIQ